MILLGSTGSIGVNTIKVTKAFNIPIESLSAGRNITLLNTQMREVLPQKIAIADSKDIPKLDNAFIKKHNISVYCGESGLLEMITDSQSALVVNALVGFAGLAPSLQAKQCSKKLALANKESLVVAGWLLKDYKITPIDSEHFGLWYLAQNTQFSRAQDSVNFQNLQDSKHSQNTQDSKKNQNPQNSHAQSGIKQLLLTASGGALRDMPLEKLANATPQEALKHPNWSMGQKITIDSATMINKLFEVLEARWLFGIERINALIEKNSLIHAFIEFVDGSLCAHICQSDMRLPIAYALNPTLARTQNIIAPLDLSALTDLCLAPIDTKRYPLWNLKSTLLSAPKLGVALNASNEIAVGAFLSGRIKFGTIEKIILRALEKFESSKNCTLANLDEIKELDSAVRKYSLAYCD
ncbi:1-deoxy-D-xylulose-5-phosphate reductoisomerase [Helicobacter himalayensis]|uniref:1-deoxy-D-xylulose-5-phosphate reductoisomerase n=1 Tax=Helicobacter himalayensis TaxID=1591088 RepID=UPI003D6DC492